MRQEWAYNKGLSLVFLSLATAGLSYLELGSAKNKVNGFSKCICNANYTVNGRAFSAIFPIDHSRVRNPCDFLKPVLRYAALL